MPPLTAADYDDLIWAALAEDLGAVGDITTQALIPEDAQATAAIVGRQKGVVAGICLAQRTFELVDSSLKLQLDAKDGDVVMEGTSLLTVTGKAQSILAAERVALNILGHLGGIATTTHTLAKVLEGTAAKLADTRKTTPGWRILEKHAVTCGGGTNHRMGLYDQVLIKDNHLSIIKSPAEAVAMARQKSGKAIKIEVEVDTLEQLKEVMVADILPDIVLLDNMPPETLLKAVKIVGGRCTTEASGNITSETIRAVAEAGVDVISCGFITHSAPNWDVGLDFKISS